MVAAMTWQQRCSCIHSTQLPVGAESYVRRVGSHYVHADGHVSTKQATWRSRANSWSNSSQRLSQNCRDIPRPRPRHSADLDLVNGCESSSQSCLSDSLRSQRRGPQSVAHSRSGLRRVVWLHGFQRQFLGQSYTVGNTDGKSLGCRTPGTAQRVPGFCVWGRPRPEGRPSA